jgi:hypothetical protein
MICSNTLGTRNSGYVLGEDGNPYRRGREIWISGFDLSKKPEYQCGRAMPPVLNVPAIRTRKIPDMQPWYYYGHCVELRSIRTNPLPCKLR